MDISEKRGNGIEVIKDLSDSYNDYITDLLSDIKEIKEVLDNNDKLVISLNQKLNDLFIKIYPKMINAGLNKQVNVQKKMNSIFIRNVNKMWKYKYFEEDGRKYIVGRTDDYYKARDMLLDRELRLNIALESVGLTSRDKIKHRRLR